jgi:hyperosmotically inducible periplasmic protein
MLKGETLMMLNQAYKPLCAAILGAALLTGCGRSETPTTPSSQLPPPATTAQAPVATPAPNAEITVQGADTTRSAGQTVSDAAVTAKVKSALLQASDVKGTDVNVDTVNGIVMLKGEVETQAQADRAVQIARNTEGVTRVDSEKLMVKAKT